MQCVAAFAYNSYLAGFIHAGIYQGRLKILPCAGFNCHSCPAAVTTCPIGAIQLFAAYGTYHVSLYVLGFLTAIGSVGGRIVCGWVCPFGLLQDLLYKIPSPKLRIPVRAEYCKYFVLVVIVFALAWQTQEPWFCKIICPAGTLEAGIPLLLLNDDLRQLISWIFIVKLSVLGICLCGMVVVKRVFCRTLCPLGAIYSLFNKYSLVQVAVDRKKCIKCDECFRACPVDLHVYREDHDPTACIRCFRCVKCCPAGAVTIRTRLSDD